MRTYQVTMTGTTPLIMHLDSITGRRKVDAWQKNPENKEWSIRGSDERPAWSWITYLMHNTETVGIASDNLMAMLRKAGSLVIDSGKKTFKSATQSGIVVMEPMWDLEINGKPVPYAPIKELLSESIDLEKHEEVVRSLGFDLFLKSAAVGTSKHIRVRPIFSNWSCSGTIMVTNDRLEPVIETIWELAGRSVGICDWRPSSPRSPGAYGCFKAEVTPLD